MKYVIVGGVAGGATAAARLRRVDEMAEIVLLEKGEHISYANCGLPYYIGGTIVEREKLLVQTPESFGARFNVDVRVRNEVVDISVEHKWVSVKNERGEVYEETYDKLLLSPGASPVRPPLEGIDLEGIFTLRNVGDTDRIKKFVEQKGVRRAVIVGAGFIGLEMAENLKHAGLEVAIVEMDKQVMAPIDYSMACLVHRHLHEQGVALYLGEGVTAFSEEDGLKVHLRGGEKLATDMVILSIGVRPQTQLAKKAGLELGEMGGIKVNEWLQTSAADVYAVGDAIEYKHPITGKPWLNYLAGPANRQGRIVADNMIMGNVSSYEGAIGTAIAKVFDLTVATTGLAAKRLKQMDMPYKSYVTHGFSNATYFPGAMPLTIKLTFHPETGQLYGAQVVGSAGVDKRIDQIAQVIKRHGKVEDLREIEHAYAPPFSSAKDPIAIAGYAASNLVAHFFEAMGWREVKERMGEMFLLDVRTPDEYAMGGLPNGYNVPLNDLRSRLKEIPHDRPILVYCGIGLRGYVAQRILMGHGYQQVYNLSGGLSLYHAAVEDYGAEKYRAWKANASNENGAGGAGERLQAVDASASGAGERLQAVDASAGGAGERLQAVDASAGGAGERGAAKFSFATLRVDACGLQCPGPIMKVKQAMDKAKEGECMEVVATDSAFPRDVEAWCLSTGNVFVSSSVEKGVYKVKIEKGSGKKAEKESGGGAPKGKTMIVFDDDLDKALATFILANGAAATGQKVTLFFTFWGLNVIKKEVAPKVKKDVWGRMFGWMLPKHSKRLALSKMNMLGAGAKMMRHLMKIKGGDSLESLRQQALDNGVEFIACQMSMDMMGIAREELLEEVSVGGVATYMQRADEANVNLFI